MKNDFLVAITQICNEKSLPKEIVMQAIEQALISAYKRNFGGGQNITAIIDTNTGKAKIFAEKAIVDKVADSRAEVSLAEARVMDPVAEVGGIIKIESTPDDFGRIAAQTAKQVILQRIREAERDALFNYYAERDGEIVLGIIHNLDSQTITVDLGKIEAFLPRAEQIPSERYYHGQKIRALITEVNKTSRGPQVLLSRTHRNMLRRLFELEVPEIFNGLVEIKAIAREPGQRSKIAVTATQDGIDPVGACIGQRGVRIQNVVSELGGEKIDIVEWSSNPAVFIANALSPAKPVAVNLTEDENGDKVAYVVVQDKQLSLAIGKEGQNARLSAKLTGWRIDIKSETQAAEEIARKTQQEAERRAAMTPEEIAAEQAALEPQPIAIETIEAEPKAVESVVAELVTAEPVLESVPTVVEDAPIAPVIETEKSNEPEKSFEQALAEFETEDEDEIEAAKRKADKRKRQVLVFDAKLGKVVAQKKHKPRGAKDWDETEDEVETVTGEVETETGTATDADTGAEEKVEK
ncbi:MAG: transcription termination/antitermination protein NusA [Chloroflexi bacterium]|nr:transcription termination/antitermination protein NusA [Chloroflexota bacterium]